MIFATDLDGTLIHTSRGAAAGLACVERYRGAPLSHVTLGGARLLAQADREALIVPATTRLPHQYARLEIPWRPRPWAVVANGGAILRGDRPDLAWDSHIRQQLRVTPLPYQDAVRLAHGLRDRHPDHLREVREAEDLFCYLVGDLAAVPADTWHALEQELDGSGWMLSRQRRKAYLMPFSLDKAAAVAYVCEQEGRKLALSAGDSALDATLVAAAPAAAVPVRGELAAFSLPPHVTVIDGEGPTVGESLLIWALAALRCR